MGGTTRNFNKLVWGKNVSELNSLLNEQVKKVIINWLWTHSIVVNKTSKNVLHILQKSLDENEEIVESFDKILYPYLWYAFKQVSEWIRQTLAPIDLNSFKAKSLKEKIWYFKELLVKCDDGQINKFYDRLLQTATPTTHIHGSSFETYDFSRLDKKSKKSAALFSLATELLLQHPEYFQKPKDEFITKLKDTLQDLLQKIKQIWDGDNEFIYNLMNFEMSPVIYMLWQAYIEEENDGVSYNDLRVELRQMDEEEATIFEQLFLFFWAESPAIQIQHKKIFWSETSWWETQDNSNVIDPIRKSIVLPVDEDIESKNQNIITPNKVNKKFQLAFNPLINNLCLENLIKWWQEICQSSYDMLLQAAHNFLKKTNITEQLAETSIQSLKTKELQAEVTHWLKTWTVQHERNVWNMSEKDLDQLARIIQAEQETFWLKSREYKVYSKWFKKPFPQWRADYYGYFQNNSWFEWMHLVLYRNKQDINSKKLVFSSGETLGIHDHLYFYTQIHYYLKHKKFLPKQVVYANLYHELNKQESSAEIFDIQVSKKQYRQFIEYLIRPFSKESLQEKSRAAQDHIVFAWLPGTWKSQFFQTLLTEKEFEFNKKNLHLNATVISIKINEFLVMISQNDFFIHSIYKNTWMPVILVIEDLDTVLADEEEEGSGIVQAISNFLQWVGETPVTIVTSTNFLHRFPQRILRPGRFNKIIWFDLKLTDEEFYWIVKQHINKNKLDDSWIDIIKNNKEHMEMFSAAYIAKVIQEIASNNDFQGFYENKESWADKQKLFEKILENMIIPLEDIQKADKQYQDTLRRVQWQFRKPLGFKKYQTY